LPDVELASLSQNLPNPTEGSSAGLRELAKPPYWVLPATVATLGVALLLWQPPYRRATDAAGHERAAQTGPVDAYAPVLEKATVATETAGVSVPTQDSRQPTEKTDPIVEEPEVPASDTAGLGGLLVGELLASPDRVPKLASPISQGVKMGILEHKVQPTYPQIALASGMRGSVVLDVTIAKDGRVRDVIVISGPYILARAAIEAVRQWRYSPYLLNGEPIEMQTAVRINFTAPNGRAGASAPPQLGSIHWVR